MKGRIRAAAEEEKRAFYDGEAEVAWLAALAPIETDPKKPNLTDAPWLIVVFVKRYGRDTDGVRFEHCYVPESTGIAYGYLIATLHHAGLDCPKHTPPPMGFLRGICGRPDHESPIMVLAAGYIAGESRVPQAAGRKRLI